MVGLDTGRRVGCGVDHERGFAARRRVRVPERIRLNTESGRTRLPVRMPKLDIRETPPVNRHDKIHGEFDGMDPGETLTIVNDHEPKPLYYEMAAEVPAFNGEAYEV